MEAGYWWSQDLDKTQIEHELGLASSTGTTFAICREVYEITLFENSQKLCGDGEKKRREQVWDEEPALRGRTIGVL